MSPCSAGTCLCTTIAERCCVVQVAFLAAMVGPKVAAAAAQRALEVLAEEDPAVAAGAAALGRDPPAGEQDGAQAAAPGQHAASC